MGTFVLVDAYILVNGVVLSDHGNQVTVEDTRDQVENTGYGAANKSYTKGLGDGKISCTFMQDFASGKVHATLQPLIASSTGFTVEVRGSSAARSATNPAAVMTALLFNYNMLSGGLGDVSTTPVEFVNASQTGIQYLTS